MKLVRLILLWCVLLAPWVAWASPAVLEAHRQGLLLNGTDALRGLTDAHGTLSIDELHGPQANPGAARWGPVPHPLPHAPGTLVHWFKVELQQRGASGDWVLATHTTALKDVRFYGPYDAHGQALAPPIHTGLAQPYASRPLGSERYLMRLQLPQPGTYTVYVRLVADIAPTLELSVWDVAEYLQWRQHKRLFDGLYYGILLALLAYNLALAGIFREAAYGFYIAQCACALLTVASFNGHAGHYLWGAWPWWQERANVVLPSLWLVSAVLFTRSFLGTHAMRWLDVLLHALALLAAGTAVLGLSGAMRSAHTLNELLASMGVLLVTLAGIGMLRRGVRAARWYLGGQALLFAAVLGVVLANWQVVDAPFLLANGLQIGVAAEMAVFAIALSHRISRLRASQIALRLHAKHLAQAAATDALTGLLNRHGLAQQATQVLQDGAPHALMLLDLNRFKPINDTYGHDAGDAVLQAVAERMQALVRANDIVARLGGDEFVILLSDPLPPERLSQLAHELGSAIAQPLSYQGQALRVGVSIGVARSPCNGNTLTELMRHADEAMYQAKQTHCGYVLCSAEAATGATAMATATR